MPARRTSGCSEAGFTIIEVMIAALILVVGLMATLTLVEGATRTSATSRSREGATNLAREIAEKSRTIPYSTLTSANLTSTVRALPGMGGGSGAWTVTRRGVSYTVTTTVCSLDDGADGYGDHSSGSWCAGSPAGGTTDAQPEDFKRIGVTIAWKGASAKQRSATQMYVRSALGTADAPQITALTTTSPAVADPASPVIVSAAVTTVTFTASAGPTAAHVKFTVDGVEVGEATPLGNGKDWTYTLSLAGRTDGSYEVGASAVDALGMESPVVTVSLGLARSVPAAPKSLLGGLNKTLVSNTPTWVVDLDWIANVERNVEGYRVYRPSGSLVTCAPSATTTTTSTACTDTSPQAGAYKVVALYRDASNTLKESAPSSVTAASPQNRIFYFAGTTANTTCGGSPSYSRDQNESTATTAVTTLPGNASSNSIRFCSPSQPAWTISNGTVSAYFYMRNRDTVSCSVTVDVGTPYGGSGMPQTKAIPPSASYVPYRFDFPVSRVPLPAGKYYTEWTRNSCSANNTDVQFGGSGTARSRVELPPDFDEPSPPSNLTGTRAADGSIALSWTASPTSGLLYYRIYRDGQNYTSRFDTTGDTSTTWTDPNRTGATHTYWVAAIGQHMEESVLLGPITK